MSTQKRLLDLYDDAFGSYYMQVKVLLTAQDAKSYAAGVADTEAKYNALLEAVNAK